MKLKSLSTKMITILIACGLIVVIVGISMIVAAARSDAHRVEYNLKPNDTYEVLDVKNTYRDGMFCKDSLTVYGEYRGVKVTSIKKLSAKGLKEIIISDGITSVDRSAFSGNVSMQNIKLPSTLKTIGISSFRNCSALTSLELPSGVTSIGDMAFYGCSKITSMVVPSAVKSVGNSAFYNCSALTSLELPANLQSLGGDAFANCTALQSITFKGTMEQWGSVTKGAFNKDGELTAEWNANSALTSVVCSDGTITL